MVPLAGLPPAFSLCCPVLSSSSALSILYAYFGQVPIVEAAFIGIKAAVLVIVIEALLCVARRALRGDTISSSPYWPLLRSSSSPHHSLSLSRLPPSRALPCIRRSRHNSRLRRLLRPCRAAETLKTAALWLAIWIVPLLLVTATFGRTQDHDRHRPVLLVTLIATFGGAYSVLAYMAQQAVEAYGWLSAGEMLDGLGLAETTPGPLILVTEFVGFPCRLPPRRRAGARLRPARRCRHAMGDLCARLPFSADLHGRALCRAREREPSPGRCAGGRHRRRSRRNPEPEPVVRAACPVRQRRRGVARSGATLDARIGKPQCRGLTAVGACRRALAQVAFSIASTLAITAAAALAWSLAATGM